MERASQSVVIFHEQARQLFITAKQLETQPVGVVSESQQALTKALGQFVSVEQANRLVEARSFSGALLPRADALAHELERAVVTEDLMGLSNAGFALVQVLDELWAHRNKREADWGDLLNLLQGALAKDDFERYTAQQCTAIKEIISKHLAADEVTLHDIENSIQLLREAGLDPWKGISGTLSE